jgi:hypothetical protein
MHSAYKIIAHIISAFVVIQAAVITWAVFILIGELISGQVPTGPPIGAILHGVFGQYVIPVLAVVLLVVALVGRAGVKWAALAVGLVLLQIALAYAAFAAPIVGILHAINAFAIMAMAEIGARAVSRVDPGRPAEARVRPAT